MPEEGNSSSEGESGNPHWIDDDFAVPEKVLDRVADLIGVAEGDQRAELRDQLRQIASDYQTEKLMDLCRGLPSQQKDAVQVLIRSLNASLRAIDGVLPEYFVQIESMAAHNPEAASLGPDTRRAISDMRDAATTFLREYRPRAGPPANVELEEALRALLALIEVGLSQSVTVAQNKHGAGGPKLKSSAALALGSFVQALDSSVLERTIVNMIVKIRNQPEMTESPSFAIFRGNPNSELDSSLLSNRFADN